MSKREYQPIMPLLSDEVTGLEQFLTAWDAEIIEHGTLLSWLKPKLLIEMNFVKNCLERMIAHELMTEDDDIIIDWATREWRRELDTWAPWQAIAGRPGVIAKNRALLDFLERLELDFARFINS
jgi:hypothetical protein